MLRPARNSPVARNALLLIIVMCLAKLAPLMSCLATYVVKRCAAGRLSPFLLQLCPVHGFQLRWAAFWRCKNLMIKSVQARPVRENQTEFLRGKNLMLNLYKKCRSQNQIDFACFTLAVAAARVAAFVCSSTIGLRRLAARMPLAAAVL